MKSETQLQRLYENMNKVFYIMRGIPSSGKSTKAKSLVPESHIFSADKFFEKGGTYNFNPSLLGIAHRICHTGVEDAMKAGATPIAVDNTNTTLKEIDPYLQLANQYGYRVEIVESDRPEWKELSKLIDQGIRSGEQVDKLLDFFYEDNKKTHNVPRDVFSKMVNRWVPTKDILKG